MNGFRQLVLSVGTAAVIVGILTSFTDTKSSTGVLIRMICGLFLIFTALKPVTNLNFDSLAAFAQSYAEAGDAAAAQGEAQSKEALRQIIKQETEAYILDKACLYQSELNVEVTVGEGEIPVPESVQIRGNLSPYARGQLQRILEEDIGIPKENQKWIG